MLEQKGVCDSYFLLFEFTYNNKFCSSIEISLFEALYGKRCRTPLCCYDSGESVVLEPDIVQQTTEKIKII